jgi:glucose/arabinose dehydrogenase
MRVHFALIAIAVAACTPATSPLPANTSSPFSPLPPTATPLPAPPATITPTASPLPAPTGTPQPDPFLQPEAYRWVVVASGLTLPLDLTHAGDERLFIVEQRGRILISNAGQLLDQPFLDLRDRVGSNGNERGLLGLAFHPDYSENGYFFINYTDLNGDTVIARFRVSPEDPQQADPASEMILLRIDQPYANHNGGAMVFGPDGMLYVGTGDGGSAGDPQGHAQRLNTLLGKILRLDIDAADGYAIPSDNPYAGGGGRPEIWAFGLRNPWRMAFDPLTGDLFIADVGQNQWEEINFLPAGHGAGTNFGWNLREGSHPYAGQGSPEMVDPVAEYSHAEGCSVTGGEVVRTPSLPAWEGVYLYGDYCQGTVWGLKRLPDGSWASATLYQTPHQITSFGADVHGEVYLIDRQGIVLRLEPAF